jgi:hypothetical protein
VLFNFHLRPPTEVAPLGRPPDLRLSWFALTDGWYWIDAGNAELFKYTPAIVEYWQQTTPMPAAPSTLDYYVDYYIVRLWEDLLDLLPAALDPIPAPLVALLNPQGDWDVWYKHFLLKWEREGDDCDLEISDLYADAVGWWHDRRLSTGYLKSVCHIWFWTDGTDIVIDWDNRGLEIEGKPVWAATWGRSRMPLQNFMDELTSFDTRLMEAMASRVAMVMADWPRRDVLVDLDALQREHQERVTWLLEALKEANTHPPTRWDRVLDRLDQIERR